jgi:hypothetical protein
MGRHSNDRNSARSLLHHARNGTVRCDDHIDVEPNKLRCHFRNEVSLACRETPNYFEVLPFDISKFAQPIDHSIDSRSAIA